MFIFIYASPIYQYSEHLIVFHRMLGKLACKRYKVIKLETASTKVQKTVRKYQKWKAFHKLRISVLVVQTGLRTMDARKKFKCMKQAKAAIVIQVQGFMQL